MERSNQNTRIYSGSVTKHLILPTPLPEYLTREFSSLLCQQNLLWRRKPYTPLLTLIYDTQQNVEF